MFFLLSLSGIVIISVMKNLISLAFLLWTIVASAWARQSYTIYPIPQKQTLTAGTARITPKVNIVAEAGIDEPTLERARQVLADHGLRPQTSRRVAKGMTNLVLGTNGSQGVADQLATRQGLSREVFGLPKYDRHIVSLTADRRGRGQLLIVGENTDAVFCGLASVEQMLDCVSEVKAQTSQALPCVVLEDYADTRTRGIIEGYYGVPYNAAVTKDLFRFMARYKMNTYMYGAKSDPYHTRYWSEPYPTTITAEQEHIGYLTQDMLRGITEAAHAAKVNFIWAIHPGTAFTNRESTDVLERVMQKFESMYSLGVRQFGVFVDDVGVPTDEPTLQLGAQRLSNLQHSIDKRWNQPGTAPADTVKPLQYVPQLYAFSWVKPEVAERFFQSLSPSPHKVDIYITGRNVWSVPNSRDLATANKWLGRKTAWWWNYPCNDNDVTKLFPMDTYANFRDEKHIQNDARLEPDLTGTDCIIINPMQQGEASKFAIFSVADYTWNHRAFDNQQSWQASLPAVVGRQRAEAMQTVAPLLRYFDQDALGRLVDEYKHSVEAGQPRPEALLAKLKAAEQACRVLDDTTGADATYLLFHEDIRPWLAKLSVMLQTTIRLLEQPGAESVPDLDGNPAFQFEILTGLGEEIALSVKTAEPAAQVLRPFIDWLCEQNRR